MTHIQVGEIAAQGRVEDDPHDGSSHHLDCQLFPAHMWAVVVESCHVERQDPEQDEDGDSGNDGGMPSQTGGRPTSRIQSPTYMPAIRSRRPEDEALPAT